MPRLNIEDLYQIKGAVLRANTLAADGTVARITVHMGTCGISSGAEDVFSAFKEALSLSGRRNIVLTTSGCAGICNQEPLVTIELINRQAVKYAKVSEALARRIFEEHVLEGRVLTEAVFARGLEQSEVDFEGPPDEHLAGRPHILEMLFFGNQALRVVRNRGLFAAEDIDAYIGRDGYFGLAKALFQMAPAEIIAEIKVSGIRGRGGAGFPTGLKWSFAASAKNDTKYVLCNADEGDPGAFMDRCVLESDPHAVIEGMIIAAKAIGAHQGYIYCRAEYPLAVKTLNLAITQARQYGLLGHDILGAGFDFDLQVYRGAGAFVCGEETALMTSIEGMRGTPRSRPPFPALQGLWKKPTILNNVETLASIAQIILNGGRWYAGLGTQGSKGTKVFALTGDVCNVGLVEVPMGISIGDIIYDIGGGIPNGKKFKAVQLGGPSGGCIPAEHLNATVDYETISRLGAIVGSGGMIVMDEDKCVVDVARFFMEFCRDESCGKCTPCRVGTQKMLQILTRICEGQGRPDDIATLEKWAHIMQNTALCGLGQTAPNPVLSTLRYFRDEYLAHIQDHKCTAVVCTGMFDAPCQHACPLNMDIPAYIALVKADRLDQAYQVLLETNPFPSVCGRVCDHVCETKCRRADLDDPLSIKHLKRFITDSTSRHRAMPVPVTSEARIAVIGAGPSGLTAARDLALRGYGVMVFEALSEPGGMLRWAIPEYRLPRTVLKNEIEAILDLGIALRLNTKIGRDLSWETIQKEFVAVYLAIGTQKSLFMSIPGDALAQGAVEFLTAFNQGLNPKVGHRVVVVGGGNSAIDAARTALRLGADKVVIVYRRRKQDMPAQPEEIRAAEAEGVSIIALAAPLHIEGQNKQVTRVVCQCMALGDFDESARRKPVPKLGEELVLECDQVIMAVGQVPEYPFDVDRSDLRTNARGLVETAKKGFTATTAAMVFAGGDVVSGPDTVVRAIAAGHRAALEIDAALRPGQAAAFERPREIEIPQTLPDEEAQTIPRTMMPEADIALRIADFREVELGLPAAAAVQEAGRCLRCDVKTA